MGDNVTFGFDGRQFSLRVGPTSPVWHWFLRRQISRRVYNQMNDKHLHFILRKEVYFRGLIDEKNFSAGNTPSPEFSEGILHASRKVA
jgi:hypothetical protein